MIWIATIGVTPSILFVIWGIWRRRQNLRAIVFDNLDAAWDGGQFDPRGALQGETPEGVAYDLQCFGGCEDLTHAEMLPYVREWMKQRGLIT